jgi:hypothetical protein
VNTYNNRVTGKDILLRNAFRIKAVVVNGKKLDGERFNQLVEYYTTINDGISYSKNYVKLFRTSVNNLTQNELTRFKDEIELGNECLSQLQRQKDKFKYNN